MSDTTDAADLQAAEPRIEGTAPDGGAVPAGGGAGGNKRDPVESSPTIGHTIAGRDINTGAVGDVTNIHETPEPSGEMGSTEGPRTGSADTGAKGVTGVAGSSNASDPPDADRKSK